MDLIREILSDSKGLGTSIAEYSELGPFHCEDCIYKRRPGYPETGQALCIEDHMKKDPEVKRDKATGLPVVNLKKGCCRYVRPPAKT